MTDSEMEEILLKNGFTPRDLLRIKNAIERYNGKHYGMQEEVANLSKNFISLLLIGVIAIALLVMDIMINDVFDIWNIIFILAVTCIILFSINIFNPLRLGLKSYLFMKKNKGG